MVRREERRRGAKREGLRVTPSLVPENQGRRRQKEKFHSSESRVLEAEEDYGQVHERREGRGEPKKGKKSNWSRRDSLFIERVVGRSDAKGDRKQ